MGTNFQKLSESFFRVKYCYISEKLSLSIEHYSDNYSFYKTSVPELPMSARFDDVVHQNVEYTFFTKQDDEDGHVVKIVLVTSQ